MLENSNKVWSSNLSCLAKKVPWRLMDTRCQNELPKKWFSVNTTVMTEYWVTKKNQ